MIIVRKWGAILTFIIGVILVWAPNQRINAQSFAYTIQGKEETDTYSFEELWKLYGEYSNTYKRNNIANEIEALKSTIAEINYVMINSQYSSIVNTIEELKIKKQQLEDYKQSLFDRNQSTTYPEEIPHEERVVEEDRQSEDETTNTISDLIHEIDTQISYIDSQIAQYNMNKGTAGTNAADAKLQDDLAYFNKEYQGLIISKTQNQLKLDFMKRCFQLIFEQEQIEYFKEYKDYLEVLYIVEEIKHKKGYSNTQDLTRTNLNLLENNNNLELAENNFCILLGTIQNDTNMKENTTLKLAFNWVERDFDTKKTVERFLVNSLEYLQLQNIEDSYYHYLNSLGITNNATYEQVKLQIKDCQLQINQLQYDIENYVKNAIYQYKLAINEMETAAEQLKVSEKECIKIEAKLSMKKSTKMELLKSYTDRISAKIAYYKTIYNMLAWEHILENNMYGVSS